MTQKEFIKVLDEMEYSYEIQGNKIVVTIESSVYLRSLTSLPPGVEFNNRGGVWLKSLTSIPPDVVFRNRGYVSLESLTSLPPGVEFNNRGVVDLRSLVGGDFNRWSGNIEGVDEKRLLNLMIKQGVFER